jgi:glycosyltransferase involved in cell wall biosynthesis
VNSDTLPNANMPRVLLAGHLPPPMSGIGTYYETLLASSLPCRVNLLFIDTSLRRRSGSETGSWSASNLVSAINDCFRFTRTVLAFRPDICHIATAFGLSFIKHGVCVVVARMLNCKVLLHPHCSFYFLYECKGRVWQYLVRKVIGLCNGIIVLSNEWKKLENAVPGCRTFYLPNAINLSNFIKIGQEKTGSRPDPSCLTILYLGHVGKAKGSFDLVGAAKILLQRTQTVTFELVGHEQIPGDIEQLHNQVVNAGLDQFIHIRAAVNGKEKIDLFRVADIFVYPSYHEGMPMAVMEAMACGLPIVATQVGGLPDLVHPGLNGILVPAGRPDELAKAIYQLVVDPQMRRSMRENSFRLAQENFDIETLVSRLLDIYQTVLSQVCE